MGLYDTLILDPPLQCPRCGKLYTQAQSKEFDCCMSTWRPGMLIRGSNVHTGIIREWIWCCPRVEGENDSRLEFWVVIWYGIYAGHAGDVESARKKLEGLDRLDLLGWLEQMQEEARNWKSRYHALHRDLGRWIDWRDRQQKEAEAAAESGESDEPNESKAKKKKWSFLKPGHWLDDGIKTSPDPVLEIYRRHGEDQEIDHGFFNW